jgi:hypothetical protein
MWQGLGSQHVHFKDDRLIKWKNERSKQSYDVGVAWVVVNYGLVQQI